MKKSEMNGLVAGLKIQSKKDLAVYTIVGIDLEQGKVILDNGKLYTMGTIQRWYSLYEEEIPQVVEPLVEDTDTTADTEETEVQVEQQDTTVEIEVVEGNTATTNTTTPQGTTQQNNLIQSLNNLVDLHGCYLEPKKEYIAVKKDGYKGTVCMIRNCRGGRGIHIDFKQKIWGAMDLDYTRMLNKNYYTGIYDKTRKLFRIGYVSDLDILEVIICTALQLVS